LAFLFLFLLKALPAAVTFSYTSPVCGTTTASFTNTSSGNIAYLWVFGDPLTGAANFSLQLQSATGTPVNHTFSSYGTYTVSLYVLDGILPSSSIIDSVKNTIKLFNQPALTLFASGTDSV